MTNDRFLEIEDQWKKEKKKYGKNAFGSLSIPVIFSVSSVDAENITKKLSRFLYAAKIMKKINPCHDDYLFFSAGYTAHHNRNFPAIQELYNYVRNAGGYYGSYRGIILVDVSEWCGHFREKLFDVFLAYLADQRANGLMPFICADFCEPEAEMQTLEAVISSYFCVTRVVIGAKDLLKYAVSLLEEQEISMDENAQLYLEGFLKRSARSVQFHGTESVIRICEGVASKCDPARTCTSLDEACLKDIITELGYCDIFHERPSNVIGFR